MDEGGEKACYMSSCLGVTLTLGSLYRARDDVFPVFAVSSIEAEEGRCVETNSMTSTTLPPRFHSALRCFARA